MNMVLLAAIPVLHKGKRTRSRTIRFFYLLCEIATNIYYEQNLTLLLSNNIQFFIRIRFLNVPCSLVPFKSGADEFFFIGKD